MVLLNNLPKKDSILQNKNIKMIIIMAILFYSMVIIQIMKEVLKTILKIVLMQIFYEKEEEPEMDYFIVLNLKET
jgi:ascorbate-specific PTS system EIIC-type component UlaA